MTQPNKVIPITENTGKAYIDPESIDVVVQILEDLKRKSRRDRRPVGDDEVTTNNRISLQSKEALFNC